MVGSLFEQVGAAKVALFALAGVVVVAGLIAATMVFSSANLTPIYSNLSSDSSAEVVEQLAVMGVEYQLQENGSQVLVPSDRVLELRMLLAQQGIPSGDAVVGYEIFDNPDALGTSNFVYNVNYRRALQGELARTISSFSQIKKARVLLNVPKRELFSRNQQEPTASVVLTLKEKGAGLSKREVSAISHVVATAVPNLRPEKITIVDTKGKPFTLGGGDESSAGYYASKTEQYRLDFERRMKQQVETLLSKVVGDGNVDVIVSADLDFDRVVMNSEIYDPDGQVVRSVQTVEERQEEQDGSSDDAVTVANNLPDAELGGEALGNRSSTERVDETTNYEISKTVKNHVRETGTVRRLSLAVLVDGIYTLDDSETTGYRYSPRTEEQLQQLKVLVSSAVGFDEERGDTLEVVNMRFGDNFMIEEEEAPYEWLKRELSNVLKTFIIGTVVVLVIVLVIKPMVGRAFEITKAEAEEAALANTFSDNDLIEEFLAEEDLVEEDSDDVLDLSRVEKGVKNNMVRMLNEILEKYPQETISIIRAWLYKDQEEQQQQ